MYICLSSGTRPRYRQDILRAIAMPKGAQLQFRYDRRWIASDVLASLSSTKGQPALIAYVDQADPTKVPEVVPCRYASIKDVVEHGSTVSILFSLEEFAFAQDSIAFNRGLQTQSANTLPSWQSDNSLKGAYWLKLSSDPQQVIQSKKLDDWESIVTQLAERSDFKEENNFYVIEGMYPAGKEKKDDFQPHGYELIPEKEYEIRTYHFHPKTNPKGSKIRFDSANDSVKFISSRVLHLDSRYDLKRVRLRAAKTQKEEASLISLTRVQTSPNGDESEEWDFDLPLHIKGSYWPTLAIGVFVGILLAAPQVTAALSNSNLPSESRWVIIIVSVIANLVAAIFAAFNFRKPV